jgi:predicted metalloendopeptidase
MSARNYFALVIIFALALIVGMSGLNIHSSRAETSNSSAATAPSTTDGSEHGFDVSNMDTSVSACTNFFQYANGGWVAKNPIPAAYPRWGSFTELAERNNAQVRDILEDAAKKKAPTGSTDQKIGDYYASCMDEAGIEAAGLKPIEPELDRIKAINSQTALEQEIARLHIRGVAVLFRFGSGQDQKDSTQVIAQIFQGGLSLPDRDYYTKDDAPSTQIREKFTAHVAKMFQLAGDDASTAESQAGTVMAIETKLAAASMARIQLRDPDARYHKMSVADLRKTAPDFDWDAYFKNVGAANLRIVNLGMPDFIKAATGALRTTAVPDWQIYLRWHVINASAPTLPRRFVDEDFEFKGRVLTGTTDAALKRVGRQTSVTTRSGKST